MHKFTTPGLLTLSLFFLSSSAMAGNAGDCAELKDPEHNHYNPTLFGLCVAWHNADENGRDVIAQKWDKRADFPLPGSEITGARSAEQDFYCPCWADVTFDDICAWGEPISLGVEEGQYGYVAFSNGVIFEGLMSNTGDSSCSHIIQQYGTGFLEVYVPLNDLSDDESLDCQAELEAIVLDRALMCPP